MKNEFVRLYDESLKEEYYFCEHESGLPIYVFPKRMSSSYALLATKFGSFYNGITFCDGVRLSFPSGMAHFLEHKLFSSEDGTDAFDIFASLGAYANAYTSDDKTVYLFSATENFYESLEQLIDFVSHPYFTEENVKKEQEIIAQEIKMCNDDPYDVLFRNLLKAMYGECVVSENACGSEKSIMEITPEKLYRCYELFYRYSNMALVACGDIDKEKVLEIVNRMLPERKEAEQFRLDEFRSIPNVKRSRIKAKMPVGKTIFQIGIKDMPAENTREMQKRDIAMTILDQMIFSRSADLYSEMFDKGLIGDSYSFGYSITKEIAFHSLYGESNEPNKVLRYIRKHLKKLRKRGLSRDDFLCAKRIFEADFIRDFDSTEDIANNLLDIVFDGGEIFEYGKIIDEITFEDVCKLFEEAFFDKNKYTVSIISEK